MSTLIVMPGQRKPAPLPSVLASTNEELIGTQGDQDSSVQMSSAPASASSRGRKRKPPERSEGRRTSKRRRIEKLTNQEPSELVQNGGDPALVQQSQGTEPIHASGNESSSGDDQPIRRRRKPRPRVDKAVLEVPEEGDPIDETMMTMKDLCNGMVQGRVSGRYLETFMKSNADTRRKREDNAKLRELTRRKELGLPVDEDEIQLLSASGSGNPLTERRDAQQASDEETQGVDQDADEEVEEEDEYRDVANITSRAPKVRYDNNGVLVVDETELEYDRQAEADAELAARGPVEVVVETDRDKFTNFSSYAKKPRPDRWSREETETFYLGLRMFHTGFDLIARLLPNRTRTMVRNKFKAEDRKNPQKITNLLSHKMRLPYDLDMLSRETGRDFSGPIPQVEPPKMIEAGIEGEESGKDDASLKQRMSTAPLSGGESDRGEGTSVSTGRGRSANKSKVKRKNKSTSKPPSTTARATSVSTSRLGSTIEVDQGTEHTSTNAIPRPPTIAVSKTFSRQGVPMIRAAGQTGN